MATLKQARRRGLIRYTGRPCRRCGSRVRYTCNSACVACAYAARPPRELGSARKRAYRARLALERHELARLLSIRDAMPIDVLPSLELAELPLPSIPAGLRLPRIRPYRKQAQHLEREHLERDQKTPAARLYFQLLVD